MRFFRLAPLVLQGTVQLLPVSAMDSTRCESLLGVARTGSTDIVHEGADMRVDVWTPLHEAARAGHLDIVKSLAGSARCLGNTMLLAVTNGHLDIVEYLLELDASLANARFNDDFSGTELSSIERSLTSHSPFALTIAITRGHRDIVLAFLRHGARVDVFALSAACRLGYNYVDILIDHGAHVNEQAGVDETDAAVALYPMSHAIRGRNIDIVKLLIQRGATRGISDGLRHSGSDRPITKLLLENGADPNILLSNDGETALHIAASRGRREIVRLLIEYGADLRRNRWLKTPLDVVLATQDVLTLQVFVEAGYMKDYEIPRCLPFSMQRALLLFGAKNTFGTGNHAFENLMVPIRWAQSEVALLAQKTPTDFSVECTSYPGIHVQGVIHFAFEAVKQGIDLMNDARLCEDFVIAWSGEKTRIILSIIDELVYLGCTDLGFYYSVAPFLVSEDVGTLKRAETAMKFLAGAFVDNMEERAKHRAGNSAILNEMIQMSATIGFRPVVKALYGIYRKESQILYSLTHWGYRAPNVRQLPEDIVNFIVGPERGPFYPGFKAKAMRKLFQAMRRIQGRE